MAPSVNPAEAPYVATAKATAATVDQPPGIVSPTALSNLARSAPKPPDVGSR